MNDWFAFFQAVYVIGFVILVLGLAIIMMRS